MQKELYDALYRQGATAYIRKRLDRAMWLKSNEIGEYIKQTDFQPPNRSGGSGRDFSLHAVTRAREPLTGRIPMRTLQHVKEFYECCSDTFTWFKGFQDRLHHNQLEANAILIESNKLLEEDIKTNKGLALDLRQSNSDTVPMDALEKAYKIGVLSVLTRVTQFDSEALDREWKDYELIQKTLDELVPDRLEYIKPDKDGNIPTDARIDSEGNILAPVHLVGHLSPDRPAKAVNTPLNKPNAATYDEPGGNRSPA
ncbi:MAG: hypothetical protein ABSA75_10295 [Candidatus Bathyarchaeia archaeon]|jgi:hypothetical protein